MKILWLTENYFPRTGGMAQSCDRIVEGLRRAGVEIIILHLTNKGKQQKEQTYNGYNFHFPFSSTADSTTQITPNADANSNINSTIDEAHHLQLLWLAIKDETNLTHVVSFGGTLSLMAAPVFAAWLRVPLVVLLRGNDLDTGIFSVRKQPIIDFALSRAAAVACVTQEKAQKVQLLYPQTKTFYTPNGIDTMNWFLLEADKQKALQLRQQFLGGATDRKIIGIFGQLKAKKGVLFCLEALVQADLAAQFHVLVVGELAMETQQWLENHQPTVSFSHFPFMDRYHLLPYYAACDVVAIPSFYDGMPNVLLEAGALGVPFLAADSGGMPDVLQDKLHGWLFQAGNQSSCEQALLALAQTDFATLQAKGRALQQHIKQNFTTQQEIEKYLVIFNF